MLYTQTAPYGALILRLSLGVMFIAHAMLKLLVFTLPGTVQFFQSVGYPGFLAYIVFAAELVGGHTVGARRLHTLGRVGTDPDSARRRPGARTQRLGVQRTERWLGVSGIPRAGGFGAGPAW